MDDRVSGQTLDVFSTCPQSRDVKREDYVRRVLEVARWSEEAGCTGILVYTDNGIVDNWLVSQLILQNTERLCPLVAIQPVYSHPYTAAKMVASLAHLHQRRVALNMLAGGFKNDLIALNDTTPHDDRYVRTTEYTSIIRQLLESSGLVNFQGKYYSVKGLKMTPPLPKELFPQILMSGSSAAGLAAAEATGAIAIVYPRPIEVELTETLPTSIKFGARVGILARERSDEAWRVAHERFPQDHRGEVAHRLAVKVSDSVWHHQLSEMGGTVLASEENPYWLVPFQTYKTFCPYLVGSYERTAAEISRYIVRGYRTFILDIPPSRDELEHAGVVFRRAIGLAAQAVHEPKSQSAAIPAARSPRQGESRPR
jgi:alkanesulfonate monooxygenase